MIRDQEGGTSLLVELESSGSLKVKQSKHKYKDVEGDCKAEAGALAEFLVRKKINHLSTLIENILECLRRVGKLSRATQKAN
jgi:hypothetical protein